MESKTKEIVELTKKLIKFKTTKDNKEELKKCIKFIKNYFYKYNVIVKEFESNGKPSLFISYTKTKKPELLLHGHIDVVEADEDQFKPTIKGDNLYGRGSIDMKAGTACLMVLMNEFSKEKPDMALMIVADEEIGGLDCTGYLVKKGYLGYFVIGAEQSSDSLGKLNIVTKEKGVLWLKIKTKGKSCHGSMPWYGDNAIDKLIKKYEQIKKLFKKTTEKNRWKTTINLGSIKGGDSPNRIPDKAELVIDIRYTEETNAKKILKKIKKIKDIEIEILENAPMLLNKTNVNFINKLKKAAEKVTKKECKLLKIHGASDLRFTSERKIPSVLFGPYGKNCHGKGEFVSIKSVELFYKAMEEFIKNL